MEPKPTLLLILDGWGYSENSDHNAVLNANTPVWDHLWNDYPHTLINTSGLAVGLPDGQMGNSEVGHMNLGAGRIVYQDFTRITRAIEDGSLADNPALCQAIDRTVHANKALHILGLLSPGGVHSHEDHIKALAELAVARGAQNIYLHAFLDGRDTPPQSAGASIAALEACFAELGHGCIASLVGRYYAMDRDSRWERVQKAYDLLSQGQGEYRATTAAEALQQAYERGETDEFVKATAIVADGAAPVTIADGDSILFANFRADRAREITQAFTEPDFSGFNRAVVPQLAAFVCMTEYQQDIQADIAFAPEPLHNSLGEMTARYGLKQLRIAETEKYAHVTFFFNGGREQTFPGEERVLIPSPKVATYDLQPEMSALEVTDKLIAAIRSGEYGLMICNYANPDMVGHTGVYEAAMQAAETIDQCLGRIHQAMLDVGGEILITADHGNLELMRDPETGQPHTAHTTNPVPLIYVGRSATFSEDGALCDIAPTLLSLMGLTQPPEMTGRALLSLSGSN